MLGQTRIVLFSEKMVHEIGITELTDYLYREPQLETESFWLSLKERSRM
ncbi:hypothetical protein [Peribacillus simplex]|nr:hypothetical protein [Peribacillus simplex]